VTEQHAPPIVRLRGVRKSFGATVAVQSIDLELRAGEVHAWVGENGAGKSTLARILGGLHGDYRGEIQLAGRALRLSAPAVAVRAGIALVHQELSLVPELSVAENVFLGREPRGRFPGSVDFGAMRQRAAALLAELGVELRAGEKLARLSPGERQLVEIAKGLAREARVLILDEPTSSLSKREAERLLARVRELRERGLALVYVSHRIEEIFSVADRISVLRDGRLVATRAVGEWDEGSLLRALVGRELARPAERPRAVRGEAILRTEELGGDGFEGVSLSLHRGELLGLAGLAGAGRSSLLRALFGLAPAKRGRVLLRGVPLRSARPADALRAGIAMVPEDRFHEGLIPERSLRENVALASLRELSRGPFIDGTREREAVAAVARRVGLERSSSETAVRRLSGGNQQKVVLARALLREPQILLLDEPTRGIDVGAKAEIHARLLELAREGTAVLLASSDLPELLALCDRILVLRGGRVVAELSREAASEERVLAAAASLPSERAAVA